MKAKKAAKRVCGIAAVILAGLLLLIGSYLYSARYRISDIDAVTSPDGEYKIVFQAVGEPDWPFGPSHARIVLKHNGDTVAKRRYDVANDGGVLHPDNWSVRWEENCVKVILSGEEQSDELYTYYFDGTVRQESLAAREPETREPVSGEGSSGAAKTNCLPRSHKWKSGQTADKVSAVSRKDWLYIITEKSDEQKQRSEKMNQKALVVIDIQNDITKHYRDIIDTVNSAVDWAMKQGMTVIYIKHNNLSAGTRTFKPGTKGAELVPELKIVSENIFVKTKSNALTSEAFSEFIRSKDIREFYITGADATACVKSTCFNMTKAGYAVHVISDCVTSYDPEKMPEMLAYYADKGCEVRSLAFYMGNRYQYRRLDKYNFTGNSLDDFVRHQTVTECLRKTGSDWELVPNAYEENWSQAQCREIAEDIVHHMNLDQTGFGAFDGGRIIGFATVSHRIIGTAARYVQLVCFQVSEEYRRQGIGRKLFSMACEEARRLGADKLYISAHSSKESHAAYRALGCSFAEEINEELAAVEPFDVQMEYRL